jgi:hypothetical protein
MVAHRTFSGAFSASRAHDSPPPPSSSYTGGVSQKVYVLMAGRLVIGRQVVEVSGWLAVGLIADSEVPSPSYNKSY